MTDAAEVMEVAEMTIDREDTVASEATVMMTVDTLPEESTATAEMIDMEDPVEVMNVVEVVVATTTATIEEATVEATATDLALGKPHLLLLMVTQLLVVRAVIHTPEVEANLSRITDVTFDR